MRACVRVSVHACVRACVRACVPAYVRACLRACVPERVHDNLLSYRADNRSIWHSFSWRIRWRCPKMCSYVEKNIFYSFVFFLNRFLLFIYRFLRFWGPCKIQESAILGSFSVKEAPNGAVHPMGRRVLEPTWPRFVTRNSPKRR